MQLGVTIFCLQFMAAGLVQMTKESKILVIVSLGVPVTIHNGGFCTLVYVAQLKSNF